MDWNWVLTNEGSQPGKLLVSHGFRPEEGFLKNDWGSYCEAPLLYLLGLGARRNPLPPASWDGWERGRFEYGGETSFSGGPIFMHQMPHGWFPLKGMRDRLGCDYWQSSLAATRIHRKYCADREGFRAGYGRNGWGLNACDGPKGYMAYGVPGPEDGTLSPTGAVSSILFEPRQSLAAAEEMRKRFGRRIWGRYGFANAYNLDRDWFDPDVIGIDLGMAMLAIENHRTGLVWRLIRSHPFCARAYRAAGLRREGGAYPRQLRAAARPISPAGQPPAPSPSRPKGRTALPRTARRLGRTLALPEFGGTGWRSSTGRPGA
jgi:hypothetical protein